MFRTNSFHQDLYISINCSWDAIRKSLTESEVRSWVIIFSHMALAQEHLAPFYQEQQLHPLSIKEQVYYEVVWQLYHFSPWYILVHQQLSYHTTMIASHQIHPEGGISIPSMYKYLMQSVKIETDSDCSESPSESAHHSPWTREVA